MPLPRTLRTKTDNQPRMTRGWAAAEPHAPGDGGWRACCAPPAPCTTQIASTDQPAPAHDDPYNHLSASAGDKQLRAEQDRMDHQAKSYVPPALDVALAILIWRKKTS